MPLLLPYSDRDRDCTNDDRRDVLSRPQSPLLPIPFSAPSFGRLGREGGHSPGSMTLGVSVWKRSRASMVWCSGVLFCTILYCTILYCTILYFIVNKKKERFKEEEKEEEPRVARTAFFLSFYGTMDCIMIVVLIVFLILFNVLR